MMMTVLGKTGRNTETGGGEAAAQMLAGYGWADKTWSTRSSQVQKWLRFCDEDDRDPLPAEEGDVLAYIGFLSLEGRVGGTSLPQYVSAVSRYHVLHNLPSPTTTPLVRALMTAYARQDDATRKEKADRVGISAALARRILAFGLASTVVEEVGACAAVLAAFVFQVRSVTLAAVETGDWTWTDSGVTVLFRRRKKRGGERRRPLLLSYPSSDAWEPGSGPLDLFRRWTSLRPRNTLLFPLADGASSLSLALTRVLGLLQVVAPVGCFYESHSPRIGGFNELLCLQFSREWIMQRLDWKSENMFSVYFDSRISVSADSDWFFGHMRRTA